MKRPFTATQRGLWFIAAMAALVALAILASRHCSRPQPVPLSSAELQELEHFRQERKRAQQQSEEEKKHFNRPSIREASLFVFDPNTADSSTFVKLGFAPWQIRNIMKYRKKGGRWRTPEGFARLYGLDKEDFLRLKPYILISPIPKKERPANTGKPTDSLWRKRFPEKYPTGTVIDLNAADTNELKRIPGIGSYYARRICDFREQLGAFISPNQLNEISGLPADIGQWFKVNGKPAVRKTKISQATFQELVRHPYLNYEQVKALFEYRRKYGMPHSWKELRLLAPYREADTTMLNIYLEW